MHSFYVYSCLYRLFSYVIVCCIMLQVGGCSLVVVSFSAAGVSDMVYSSDLTGGQIRVVTSRSRSSRGLDSARDSLVSEL